VLAFFGSVIFAKLHCRWLPPAESGPTAEAKRAAHCVSTKSMWRTAAESALP